jgi:hypothetical protein
MHRAGANRNGGPNRYSSSPNFSATVSAVFRTMSNFGTMSCNRRRKPVSGGVASRCGHSDRAARFRQWQTGACRCDERCDQGAARVSIRKGTRDTYGEVRLQRTSLTYVSHRQRSMHLEVLHIHSMASAPISAPPRDYSSCRMIAACSFGGFLVTSCSASTWLLTTV